MARIVVVGAGAIGAGLGGLLAESGAEVVLVARGAHGQALAEQGLLLRTPQGARRLRLPVWPALRPGQVLGDDLVLLSVMGHHTAAVLPGLPPGHPVVSLQNGLAPRDQLVAAGHPCTAAVVYVPAERRAPGEVLLAGAPVPGTVWLGGWPAGARPEAARLAELLRAAGLRARAVDEVGPWVRAKLLTDLGGILVALCDAPSLAVVEAVRGEARAVFAAAGQSVAGLEDLVDEMGHLDVVPVDGHVREGGATRHALRRGDPLETATLHGTVIELGQRHGVPTPVNVRAVALARRAEAEGWRPGRLSAAELERAVLAGGVDS
jgi:2-dehydropantoate 2-reductase